MSLVTHRDQIIAELEALKAAWPQKYRPQTIKHLAAQVDKKALDYISHNAPMLIVVVGNASDYNRRVGTTFATVPLSIVVVAKDMDGESNRDTIALAMADNIAAWLHRRQWADSCNSYPQDIRNINQQRLTVDKRGLSLRAVEWRQELSIQTFSSHTQLQDLNSIYTETPVIRNLANREK